MGATAAAPMRARRPKGAKVEESGELVLLANNECGRAMAGEIHMEDASVMDRAAWSDVLPVLWARSSASPALPEGEDPRRGEVGSALLDVATNDVIMDGSVTRERVRDSTKDRVESPQGVSEEARVREETATSVAMPAAAAVPPATRLAKTKCLLG